MKTVSLSVHVDAGFIAHNNRTFTPKNVVPEKMSDNIVYKQEDIKAVYEKLFGAALQAYNAKQTRKDRKIKSYFEHIANAKQEKLFYEAVVQFGDKNSHGVGTLDGEKAKQMLDEYMRDFEARNPNLYVFNAVLHLDEASPHLHIDFVPFATNQTQGLETRVTLRGALSQQGVEGKKRRLTARQQWAVREKAVMADIAEKFKYEVINKGIHRSHMSVDEYKRVAQEIEKLEKRLAFLESDKSGLVTWEDVFILQNQHQFLKAELQVANIKANSPIIEIIISDDEKMSAVCMALQAEKISYAETAHGVSIPQYAEKLVSKTLSEFKPQRINVSLREKLALDIDESIYFSESINELLKNLEEKGYETKRGKHIAVRPANGERFIRFRSLGEEYTEDALKQRIDDKDKFQNACYDKIQQTTGIEKDLNIAATEVVAFFYQRKITPRKADRFKPYSHRNDYRIDRLLECARLVSTEIITTENLPQKIATVESRNTELIKLVGIAKQEQQLRS
jgi:hypothetical protein